MKPSLIATLAVGLPETSRIRQKYTEIPLTLDQILLAMIEDSLNGLIWGLSKKRGKRPKSVLKELMKKEEKKDNLMSFHTPEEYEAWRTRKREIWNNG